MSTDPATSADIGRTVDLDAHYRLNESVSLRPERFGALAYSFDTRKLSFLKHPDLVAVVERLDGTSTVREAFIDARVQERRWPGFITALATLEQSEMIRRTEESSAA